jgi:long-chain acyl-CoA synthetase
MGVGNRHSARIGEETADVFRGHTLPQILMKQAERLGAEATALREKAYGIWQSYTWQEYLHYTRLFALGLVTLGLKRGEHVGLITDNHPEWLFSELGAQALGAVTLNLFSSAVTTELVHGLTRIQAAYVVAQDQEQVDKLLAARDELSFVRQVIYIDPTGMRGKGYQEDAWLSSFRDVLELGEKRGIEEPELFRCQLWQGKDQETAVMMMTSGTTGEPKLVMLTHQNFTAMASKWLQAVSIGIGENWLSITPPAWIVDQMWGLGVSLMGGLTMNFPETAETIPEDFRELGPTVLVTSSRFWEDLASKIRVKIRDAGFIKRWLYRLSQRVGTVVVDRESAKREVPLHLQILTRLSAWAVSRPLLDRVGCLQFKAAYTGGHPISPDVIRFFRANGLNLKQCYGLTEAGGIFQVQPDGEVKPETVGRPLPGTEIKINEDQEVFVSSTSNFAGYYQNPEATAKALEGGWFHTGDAGYLDEDGHLIIIGRKEDIMRTAEGDAFSPDFIETRLKFSPYIKEAVVWGEGRAYLTGFINIDFGNVANWAEEQRIPYTTYIDLSQQPLVERLICAEVQAVNTRLPAAMKVSKMVLLYKLLDADEGELTRTGKVRRKFVYQQYRSLIRAMYNAEETVDVSGEVRYRDGHVGRIETQVKILTVESKES